MRVPIVADQLPPAHHRWYSAHIVWSFVRWRHTQTDRFELHNPLLRVDGMCCYRHSYCYFQRLILSRDCLSFCHRCSFADMPPRWHLSGGWDHHIQSLVFLHCHSALWCCQSGHRYRQGSAGWSHCRYFSDRFVFGWLLRWLRASPRIDNSWQYYCRSISYHLSVFINLRWARIVCLFLWSGPTLPDNCKQNSPVRRWDRTSVRPDPDCHISDWVV